MSSPELKRPRYPSLLDRLTDTTPDQRNYTGGIIEPSPREWRQQVLRDLSSLLNAKALHPSEQLVPYPQVEWSVLNYGLPDLAGKMLSQIKADKIAEIMETVLRRFEPRLQSDSLCVTPWLSPKGVSPANLSFLIEGHLWALPYPQRLYFRTDLDLETGRFSVLHDEHFL